jgi:copper homeostasis protein
MKLTLEACIETLEEAVYASNNGAHNVEVCSRLDLDGLTPSISLVDDIERNTSLGQNIMIRSRAGDFNYTESEILSMISQIETFKLRKVTGFVFGATKISPMNDVGLDLETINRIAEASLPYPLTIHKAIDVCSDILLECQLLENCHYNIKYVLTSGGKATALEGKETIKSMQEILSPKINVIAAGKVTPDLIGYLHQYCDVSYFHGKKIV